MIYSSKDMESRAVLDTAAKICAAARTAAENQRHGRPRDLRFNGRG